jgi:Calx-beta domain/FG-GAP-like repeat
MLLLPRPWTVLLAVAFAATAKPSFGAVSAPVLKWSSGGCTSFCQTGWYSSPAVADIDGDGQAEVVWGSYDVVSLNGATGALEWRGTNGQRVWPGVVVADLTGDGTLEVIVGRGGDQVTVYNRFGAVLWTRNPFGGGEVRTLAVADLENDGLLEIVVGRASPGGTRQLNVYEPDGSVRPGWPARRNGEPGFGSGMYNENVAVADMNGDGFREVLGPTDTHYITALDRGGNQLLASTIYGSPAKVWSQVGVHVDHAVDLRGFANCGVEHRPNFADSPPIFADVNGDGTREWIVVGNVYNCGTSPYTSLYRMPFILRNDRTRWSGSGFDWTAIPLPGPGSGPLSEDYNEIESAGPNPVAADLDNDGRLEILYPSYDGKVHAYWLDKTEHGSWPYVVPASGAGGDTFRFAGEPVVADLDNDGQAEVLFTSWPRKGGGRIGHLHILSSLGVELHRVSLPAPVGGATWNGGLGAPTLANLDADAGLEVVVGTTASGAVAYDLPGTANARVLWGTGRGGVRRTGGLEQPFLTIDDVSVAEGNAGTTNAVLNARLSFAAGQTVTVAYATANGTASAGSDYTATSGVATFPMGSTTQPVTVPVAGDVLDEANETFSVNLTAPSGAVITDGQGVGTILDDDPTPSVVINDVLVPEGDSGTTQAGFTLSLSAPSGQTVAVGYATANGTASAGTDYVALTSTAVFPPGTTSAPLAVTVNGDHAFEADETFAVNLSSPVNVTIADPQGTGTIGNDDNQGLSIADLAIVEPPSGTRTATFLVTLSPTSGGTVTVDYDTASDTATAGTDYQSASGTLTFTPGTPTQPVSVTVNADSDTESPETFFVNLSNASGGAAIAVSQAVGSIYDPGIFFTLVPCRVFDTRNPNGPYGGPSIAANTTRNFVLAGQCGIPATARAVSINVTVTGPTAPGNLRLFAAGAPVPLVSTLNYSAGQTRGNNAFVGLGPTGLAVRAVQGSGSVHVILDVNGYFE